MAATTAEAARLGNRGYLSHSMQVLYPIGEIPTLWRLRQPNAGSCPMAIAAAEAAIVRIVAATGGA
jgi:hypothetical protein